MVQRWLIQIQWKFFTTFFLILKNLELLKTQIKIFQKMKNLTCHKKINQELFDFYKNLFSEYLKESMNEIVQFLNLVSIPQLKTDQWGDCKFIQSEKDLLVVLKSIPNNKLPSNNGLNK